MLLVTTTVRVLNGVHGNTTNLRPAVTLDTVLVVSTTSLEDGLVNTTTTSDHTDGSTSSRGDDLLSTRGEADTGGVGLLVVGDDSRVVTRGTSKLSAITSLLLNVADDGTFRKLANGKDVANSEGSIGTSIDVLTGVDTFSSDEGLLDGLVLVRVTEDDGCKGSTTTRIVDDLLDNTLDVAVTLGIIEATVLCSTLTVGGVSVEDGIITPTLSCGDLI